MKDFACEPSGMAWPSTNDTLYMADAITKNITRFDYGITRFGFGVTNPTILVDFNQWDIQGTPRGIVSDTSDHLWVGLAQEDKSVIVEIDPTDLTKGAISTIEIGDDANIVSMAFGGEARDRLYVLTEKHLYKVSDLGVVGNRVYEFVYREED
jgi:sugar lactone lactonase YvrE